MEWAFEPERLVELRAVAGQTGGRELLDISKAWLRPPFVAETSLRLPLGIALLLLVVAEALMTRTGWKLPVLALPKRSEKAPRVKVAKQRPKREKVVEPVAVESEEPVKPPVAETTERSSRFQRAKDRK